MDESSKFHHCNLPLIETRELKRCLNTPSDYSEEPPRHPCLKINAKEPFNAEPPRSNLISSYVTPVDLFYKRNHGPIPKLQKHTVVATLQCAGNRRTAMSKTKTVRGVGWDIAAIGNAAWSGAKLADVLNSLDLNTKHDIWREEENGGPYKASIPLIQATNPEADVLLAYEMNGQKTLKERSWIPIAVIVLGVIGARSVKWLDSMNIIAEECQHGKVNIKGYAVSGGGRGIERVDVSIDGGKSWVEASRYQRIGVPYVADDANCDKWAWVFFEAEADITHGAEIVAKAVDTAANVIT
ncbi:hypothetical protein Leryth_004191 [Lithospermum erythrorhizon]|nr:hypothetical protein Leryth_004191 [Lithospermum erythrorhizon]